MKKHRYVALLRGINVGGHKKVPMKTLVQVMEEHGFEKVTTILASGNVIFESSFAATQKLPKILAEAFGFDIPTLTLPISVIEQIVQIDPYKNIKITPDLYPFVTFTFETPKAQIKIPFQSPTGAFRILKQIDNALICILNRKESGTPIAMSELENIFGKSITSRTYNTVVKIAQYAK